MPQTIESTHQQDLCAIQEFDASGSAVRSFLADAEDDKLSWFHYRNADLANQATIIEIVLSHGGAVTFHKVSRIDAVTLESPGSPFAVQEIFDRYANPAPQ